MLKRFAFSTITVLVISNFAFGQRFGLILSDSSKVSLLTCSSGDELYSVFGHSAVRVNDPTINLDVVFNYGTFDFSDPNFYTNFVKGRLNYILSLANFNRFKMEYEMEERWIFEQVLNLEKNERQQLLDSLLINYQPENRYYLYDFFMDNCATRIRDIFVEGIPKKIEFNYSSLHQEQSFRQLLQPYLVQKPWARLGIDLALGLPADRIATPWDYMFLPDHMLTVFKNARFIGDSISVPFATEPVTLLEGKIRNDRNSFNQPLLIFILFMAIGFVITYFDYRKNRLSNWFDVLLLVLVGFLGVLITFLWFFTDHQVTPWNLNIIWANPLHLAAVILLFVKRFKRISTYYFATYSVILVLLIVFWYLIPQHLPWTIYPIVILLTARFSARWLWLRKNSQ